MSDIRFTKDHEWIRVEGDEGVVGITDFAQVAMGDVVFVELPALGRTLARGEEAAVVESVKAASEVYSPVSGEVVAANAAIVDQPGLVNESPENGAWFFRVRLADKAELAELLDRDAYDAYVKTIE